MLKVNKDWQIDTDQMNIILQQRKTVSDENSKNFGNEYWKNIGYYSTYKQALCALVDYEVKVSADYKDIVKRIDQLKEDIANLPIINSHESLKQQINELDID